MRKLLAVITVAAFMIACNNSETKTETTAADSTASADSASHNTIDTSGKVVDQAKQIIDTAAKKMDKAAMLLKDSSAKK
jgi:maltose-binding protein MalE